MRIFSTPYVNFIPRHDPVFPTNSVCGALQCAAFHIRFRSQDEHKPNLPR